jgi:hypothetical protein
MASPCLPLLLQDVAVKQPLDKDGPGLDNDLQWLTLLQGKAGVPHLLGTCNDQHDRRCIIASPVGEKLTFDLWNSCSCTGPLHQLLPGFVRNLKQLHGEAVIRDLRPANLVLADRQLILVDFGSAISVGSVRASYSGTVHYASNSVLRQLQQGAQVTVTPADDLVSLVRGMFAVKHPAIAAQLSLQGEQEVPGFWQRHMGTHAAWQAAEMAAAGTDYDQVAEALERLMQ